MARFLNHGPCNHCNSRDNRAHYDDGSSYCFGCGRSEGSRYNPLVAPQTEEKPFTIPSDCTTEFPKRVLEWILKYDVYPEELIKRNVKWSPSLNLLLFLHKDFNHGKHNTVPQLGGQLSALDEPPLSLYSGREGGDSRYGYNGDGEICRDRFLGGTLYNSFVEPPKQDNLFSHSVNHNGSHPQLHSRCIGNDGHYTGYSGRSFSTSNQSKKYINRQKQGSVQHAFYEKEGHTETSSRWGAQPHGVLSRPLESDSVFSDRSQGQHPSGAGGGAPIDSGKLQFSRRALVLVEDCLSAIKIARQEPSYALLTSSLSLSKIERLASRFDAFTAWLDADMWHRATQIARRFELLGKPCNVVYTIKDPKEYSDKEIANYLLTNK